MRKGRLVMCQCGCSDFNGQWRIPGPDGKWYVIGLYHGCKDCSTPAGLSIDLMDEAELADWDAQDLPVIGGPDHPNFGIGVLDIDLFRVALFKCLDDHGVNCGEDEEVREDLAAEMDLHALIGGVVWETGRKENAEIAEAERRRKGRVA